MVKDYSYVAVIDSRDRPIMLRLGARIKEELRYAITNNIEYNPRLSDDYLQKCEQKWNDHHSGASAILTVGNQSLEFEQVSKADDLATTGGLNHMVNLIIGASSTKYEYVGWGTGTTAVSISQTALASEVLPRAYTAGLNAWQEFGGMTLRWTGVFSESLASTTVTECGIFATASAGAAMLNRNMFSNAPAVHTVNLNAFVISCVLEFVPKAV